MNLESAIANRRLTPSAAFTIIELLVATLIVGIVSVSFYAGLAQSFNSLQNARQRLRATQILTEKLEVIRLYNWTQVNTPGFIPATFTEYFQPLTNGNAGTVYRGTVIITNAPVHSGYTNTMRKGVVRVTWVGNGINQEQTMETLISQYGIQNYVY